MFQKVLSSLLLPLLTVISVEIADSVAAADELIAPVMRCPLPEEYGDQFRRFQGIPSLAVTDDNNIWATWYSGGTSEDQYNYVVVIHSSDKGNTWSKPLFALDQPGAPREYDPSFWYAPDGTLRLYWSQRPGHAGEADLWTITCSQPNSNPVWSQPQYVTQGVMMNKPIADSSGRWAFPVSVWNLPWAGCKQLDQTDAGPSGAWFVVSSDGGKTYEKLGRGYTPPELALFDEHSIVELRDGRFWMVNRTRKGMGEFFSSDKGKTWTDCKPSEIRHTSSRFFLRRLASGNLILVKNGPIQQDVGRSQMTAFISKDDGKTWEGGLILDPRNNVSYPDGDQSPDGTIYLVYDFERYGAKEICVARVTEADILAGKLVSPQSRLQIVANKAFGASVTPDWDPKPVKPRDNKDGSAFLTADESAAFETIQPTDSIRSFETAQKLFSNRSYVLNEVPDYLKGRNFLFSSIDKTIAVCTRSGIAYIVTPMEDRNQDSVVEAILKAGFQKAAKPEFILFGASGNDMVTLFQKRVEKGERIDFDKWGVLIF